MKKAFVTSLLLISGLLLTNCCGHRDQGDMKSASYHSNSSYQSGHSSKLGSNNGN